MSDNYRIGEPAQRGQIVYLDGDGTIRVLSASAAPKKPIGIALRDLRKGELVVYTPGRNSDDIAVAIPSKGEPL